MIKPDSVQSRFSSADLCRFVSYARICDFFMILNIRFLGRYMVPQMRFECCTRIFNFEPNLFPTIDCVMVQISGPTKVSISLSMLCHELCDPTAYRLPPHATCPPPLESFDSSLQGTGCHESRHE